MSFSLKYRPRSLEEIVGQDAAVLQVKGLVAKKDFPQSILITGPVGTGKTTLARVIARLANGVPENQDKLVDTQEIDGAESRGIDDVRQLIKASKFAPRKNYRIFILDEIHQWTPQAKQAFLKTLEEPSARTLFVLCTSEPNKLPASIKSRCYPIRLGRVSPKNCKFLLRRVAEKEHLNIDDKALNKLIELTKGNLRDLLQALEAVGNYAEGGGDLSDSGELLAAVESVVLVPPSNYLHKYLLSIYKGKYITALRIAKLVENVDYFLMCAAEAHEQAFFSCLSPKLVDPYTQGWAAQLEKAGITKSTINVELFSDILNEILKAAELVKSYVLDPQHVLIALTAKLVTMQRRADAVEE